MCKKALRQYFRWYNERQITRWLQGRLNKRLHKLLEKGHKILSKLFL